MKLIRLLQHKRSKLYRLTIFADKYAKRKYRLEKKLRRLTITPKIFVTLTFSPKFYKKEEIEIREFINRVKNTLGIPFQYCWVLEAGGKRKRWHYHMIIKDFPINFNKYHKIINEQKKFYEDNYPKYRLPNLAFDKNLLLLLSHFWRKGIVHSERITDTKKAGDYINKYVNKDKVHGALNIDDIHEYTPGINKICNDPYIADALKKGSITVKEIKANLKFYQEQESLQILHDREYKQQKLVKTVNKRHYQGSSTKFCDKPEEQNPYRIAMWVDSDNPRFIKTQLIDLIENKKKIKYRDNRKQELGRHVHYHMIETLTGTKITEMLNQCSSTSEMRKILKMFENFDPEEFFKQTQKLATIFKY